MENFYTILGIPPHANQSEIRNAYLRLAREYHPDKFLDEKEKIRATEIFAKITEAYRILSDEKLKADYDKSLQTGVTPKDEAQKVQAKNAFLRGLEFLKRNDPWRAVNFFRIACRYKQEPLYLSYLGLALVYTRQYQKEGFEKLTEAKSKLMFNPIVYINLGLAYEFIGNKDEALANFYEVLQWDPQNEQALKGIERLKPKKSNFFSKLFGK